MDSGLRQNDSGEKGTSVSRFNYLNFGILGVILGTRGEIRGVGGEMRGCGGVILGVLGDILGSPVLAIFLVFPPSLALGVAAGGAMVAAFGEDEHVGAFRALAGHVLG